MSITVEDPRIATMNEAIVLDHSGPRQCCAEYAIVERCDGETDYCWCGVCDRRWAQPCAVGDFVSAVER